MDSSRGNRYSINREHYKPLLHHIQLHYLLEGDNQSESNQSLAMNLDRVDDFENPEFKILLRHQDQKFKNL